MGSCDPQIYTSIPDRAAWFWFTWDTICDSSVTATHGASGVHVGFVLTGEKTFIYLFTCMHWIS